MRIHQVLPIHKIMVSIIGYSIERKSNIENVSMISLPDLFIKPNESIGAVFTTLTCVLTVCLL